MTYWTKAELICCYLHEHQSAYLTIYWCSTNIILHVCNLLEHYETETQNWMFN